MQISDEERRQQKFNDASSLKRGGLTRQAIGFVKGKRSPRSDMGIPPVSVDFEGGDPWRVAESEDRVGPHDTIKTTEALLGGDRAQPEGEGS